MTRKTSDKPEETVTRKSRKPTRDAEGSSIIKRIEKKQTNSGKICKETVYYARRQRRTETREETPRRDLRSSILSQATNFIEEKRIKQCAFSLLVQHFYFLVFLSNRILSLFAALCCIEGKTAEPLSKTVASESAAPFTRTAPPIENVPSMFLFFEWMRAATDG